MSGGESNPPAIRARFGVLGHRSGGNYSFNRIHWDIDKHKKRMKAIRSIMRLPGSSARRHKQTKDVSDPSETIHPWFSQ